MTTKRPLTFFDEEPCGFDEISSCITVINGVISPLTHSCCFINFTFLNEINTGIEISRLMPRELASSFTHLIIHEDSLLCLDRM